MLFIIQVAAVSCADTQVPETTVANQSLLKVGFCKAIQLEVLVIMGAGARNESIAATVYVRQTAARAPSSTSIMKSASSIVMHKGGLIRRVFA
jgi:hypothetical protein